MLTSGHQIPAPSAPVEARPIEGFRLSPAQARLWRLHAGASSGAYRVQGAARLQGVLDLDRLGAALARVVARYEILRTTFPLVAGLTTAVQAIQPIASLPPIDHRDIRRLDRDAQQRELDLLFEAEAPDTREDVRTPSPRLSVLTIAPEEHLLMLSLVALCADAVTIAHLLHEIGSAYEGSSAGVDEEPLQYADVAEWQHELLGTTDAVAARERWTRLPRPASLRRPSPQHTSAQHTLENPFRPRRLHRNVDADVRDALDQIAAAGATSLSTVLAAAWMALVARLTEEPAIVIGLGVDGRSHDELKGAVGLFGKFVPLSCRVSPASSFADLVARVTDAVAETVPSQDYFDGAAVGEPAPEEQIAWAPRTVFPLCYDHVTLPASPGRQIVPVRLSACVDRFELKLIGVEHAGGLDLELHVDPTVHTETDAALILERLLTLLAGVASAPARPLRRVPVVGAGERRLLDGFSTSVEPAAWPGCVHERFAEQARQTPAHVAVRAGDAELTYAALDDRATRLACLLRDRGVTAETIVATWLDRSIELVVAVLGILKAGGAYLPLDPASPPAHARGILEDASVRVVLTHSRFAGRVPDASTRTICVDALPAESTRARADLVSGASAHTAAYVLYTSGSTGRPKGVVIEHGSLMNYLAWVRRSLFDEAAAGLPFLTELTFDACLKQLFAPLIAGETVHILPKSVVVNPQELLAAITAGGMTRLNCVPSLWSSLLNSRRRGAD